MMKTLDEVIFEAPYSPTPWEADALSYLKQYKDLQYGYIKAIADLEDNPPLSWDALKDMVGKPVWIEDNLETPEDITKYWVIVVRFEKVEGDEYALLSDLYYEKSQYGKDWIAYRKERE